MVNNGMIMGYTRPVNGKHTKLAIEAMAQSK